MKGCLKNIFWGLVLLILLITLINACTGKTNDPKDTKDTPTSKEASAKPVEAPKLDKKKEAAKVTKQEEDYAAWLETYAQDYSVALLKFSTLLETPNLEDEEWSLSLIDNLTDIQTLVDDGRDKKDVPKKFKNVHKYMMKASDKYEHIPKDLPKALDSEDIPKMNQIARNIDQGNDFMLQAQDEMILLVKDHIENSK